MTRDLAADVNASMRGAFARLAAHTRTGGTRRFGPLSAVSSGLSLPVSNQVFVFERPPREDLEAAVEWMRERHVPFRVTATASAAGAVEGLAGDLDLATVGEIPGMALDSLDGEGDVTGVRSGPETGG